MSADKERTLLESLAGIKSFARAEGDYAKTGRHASFFVQPADLVEAMRTLIAGGWFLEDITALDVTEGILVNYHLDLYEESRRVVVRVIAPHGDKTLPSITSVYSGAEWHEREVLDFYGVDFPGNPNFKPLLLPDDLGVHPLLKEEGKKMSVYALLPQAQLVDNQ